MRRETRVFQFGFLAVTMLLLGGTAASATGTWLSVPFDDASAGVMQGILDGGPNQRCVTTTGDVFDYPGTFHYRHGNPSEPHLFQSYTLYNNGPERCAEVQLTWLSHDCGGLPIGVGLYLDSFDPSDPTQHLLAHSYYKVRDFFGFGDDHYNDYYYSEGFYRDEVQNYHLDSLDVTAVVPALSRIVVVLDSTDSPGDSGQCPVAPAYDLVLTSAALQEHAIGVTVDDTGSYEFNTGDSPTLDFYVSLTAQLTEPFTVHYQTAGGSATSGVDFTATAGNLTFDPGQTLKLVQVPIVGDDAQEPDEQMTLTLSNPNPPGVPIVRATATGTIFDDDDPNAGCRITNHPTGPLPPGKVGQPYGPVDFTPSGKESSDDYAWTVSAGATPPGVPLTTFRDDPSPPGDHEIHGRLAGTPTQAGDFPFTFTLDCPQLDGGHDTKDVDYTIHVDPEDPPVLVTLDDAQTFEGDSGLTPLLPQIHLSAPLPSDLLLEVLTFDSSAAVADPDYLALPPGQQILIPAGETVEPVPLDVVGDLNVEADEQFLVVLRTPITHQTVASATMTILNDDGLENPAPIPALDGAGLAALALGLGGAALWHLRRRRAILRR